MQSAISKWVQGLQFVARGRSGHAVVLDAHLDAGGTDSGPRPGELTLMALGSCTGMDVVSILKKMRVSFESFEVEVSGETAPEHPRVWTEVWVKYRVKGDVPEDKLEKAIELSRDRYCSVGALFKRAARMHYEYEIVKD